MNKISNEIKLILEKNNINKNNYIEELIKAAKEINNDLFEQVCVNEYTLYLLKDCIWYNFEHLTSGGENVGITDFRFLGKKYPNIIDELNNFNVIENKNIKKLLDELNDIRNKWNKNITRIQILVPDKNDNIKEAKVKIISENDYYKIKNIDKNIVLCIITNNISDKFNSELFRLLFDLIKACEKALINKKDLDISFLDK